MNDMQICKMNETHIAEIVGIEKNSFTDPWSEQAFRAELENDYTNILVLLCNDEVCAYICIFELYEAWYLANIAVKPEYRRRGYAEALLNEAEKNAYEKGCMTITLEVRESNEKAISLYEKHQYFSIGKRKDFYENPVEDALIMVKSLYYSCTY